MAIDVDLELDHVQNVGQTMATVNVQVLQPRINTTKQRSRQKRQLNQDTRGSINDGAAALQNEWRSLPDEGPPHVITKNVYFFNNLALRTALKRIKRYLDILHFVHLKKLRQKRLEVIHLK